MTHQFIFSMHKMLVRSSVGCLPALAALAASLGYNRISRAVENGRDYRWFQSGKWLAVDDGDRGINFGAVVNKSVHTGRLGIESKELDGLQNIG